MEDPEVKEAWVPPDGNGGPGGNPPTGEPPQKPTDANGNELEMPEPPSSDSSQTEKN